jgi:hypothetical protein
MLMPHERGTGGEGWQRIGEQHDRQAQAAACFVDRCAMSGWLGSGKHSAFSQVDVNRSEHDVSNAGWLKLTETVF